MLPFLTVTAISQMYHASVPHTEHTELDATPDTSLGEALSFIFIL